MHGENLKLNQNQINPKSKWILIPFTIEKYPASFVLYSEPWNAVFIDRFKGVKSAHCYRNRDEVVSVSFKLTALSFFCLYYVG